MASGFSLKKEIGLGAVLLAFGFVGLPASIYLVGQQVVGEYAPGQGLADLFGAIWTELGAGNPAAWLLVTSPYLVISLLRLSWATWRSRRPPL